jgi:sugar transferase (PEP-CTERM/EpsH1 system associated)
MRILMVVPRVPWPLDKGDRLTVHHYLRFFAARHAVTLVAFAEDASERAGVEHVRDLCARVEVVPLPRARGIARAARAFASGDPFQIEYYRSAAMRRRVAAVAAEERPDVAYAHTLRMAQYVRDLSCPRVLGAQVSMTLNYERLAARARSPLRRIFYRMEHRRLRACERSIAAGLERCLVISEKDRAAIEAGGEPLENAMLLPHGVDGAEFSPDPRVRADPATIVLTGNMGYAPNEDAAVHFCASIFPRVLARRPDARLAIVGTDPTRAVRALAQKPGVEVTGRVPRVVEWLRRAEVAVAPLRVGAGLQNKVLEAMATGLPVVATSIANEGIGAPAGRAIEIADEPQDFAEAVVSLLADPGRRERMGRAARAFIEERFTWERYLEVLEADLARLAGVAAPEPAIAIALAAAPAHARPAEVAQVPS